VCNRLFPMSTCSAITLRPYVAGLVSRLVLPATLFAHASATLGGHRSAALCDHGGPLIDTAATVSPG